MASAAKESRGISPLAIVALIIIAVPMVFTLSSSSSSTINGKVVEATFFDPVAVVCGAAGIFFALLFGAAGNGGRIGRWVTVLIISLIGARHIVHGLGLTLPGSHPPSKTASTGPVCDEDSPESCVALCDADDGDACDELGLAYALGEGGFARDDSKAEPLFIKACQLKDPQGCSNIATMFFKGQTTTIDAPKAVEFARHGCLLKHAQSCSLAGMILADGKGLEADWAAARPLLEQGCTGGSAVGCLNAGNAARDGRGGPFDEERALGFYTKGCELKEGDSCNSAGVILDDEDRTADERAKATEMYVRGCELKSEFACSNLGHQRFTTNPADALDPLEKACVGGRTRACEELGVLLFGGAEGVPVNLEEARRIFAHGCELGHANSCVNEGIMQSEGQGGPVDLDEAAENLRTGCNGGESKGCARLGVLLATTDPVAAKPLLVAGCKSKFMSACAALKTLGKSGKPKPKPGKKR